MELGRPGARGILRRPGFLGQKRLADLPRHPLFIINATNLQTGRVWRFTRDCTGDDAVGYTSTDDLTLATAIAGSSAYPPFLSPLVLDLEGRTWTTEKWPQGDDDAPGLIELYETLATKIDSDKQLQEQYRDEVMLSDGGLADNLGATTIIDIAKELFVSDGGAGLNVTDLVDSGPIEWSHPTH